MNAIGQGGVGAVGVVTEVTEEPTRPYLSPHAMPLKEAIKLADRWSAGWKEEPGGLGEVLSVLVDRIVTVENHLKETQKALSDAHDRIQALTLDLGLKEHGR